MQTFYIHANVNKTVHRTPSTNCRCEEAETKATVTLMASLVIKRPLMYVLNSLFYLLLPLCLSLSLSLHPARPVSLLMPSFGNVLLLRALNTHLTSGWRACILWHQSLASKEHLNAKFVAILGMFVPCPICIHIKFVGTKTIPKKKLWHAIVI